MRLTAGEKYEIIQQVTRSELGVKKTLQEYNDSNTCYYLTRFGFTAFCR